MNLDEVERLTTENKRLRALIVSERIRAERAEARLQEVVAKVAEQRRQQEEMTDRGLAEIERLQRTLDDHLQSEAAETMRADRAESEVKRLHAAMPRCPDCGPVRVDEDGCCITCGADTVPPDCRDREDAVILLRRELVQAAACVYSWIEWIDDSRRAPER